ncbi:MAG: NAD(P)-binding domain-containing protein, partial [Thermoanaerobaculia bacterium]
MSILEKIKRNEAIIGIIGMGYVGLPLALLSSKASFQTLGFDVDGEKVKSLNSGKSYIKHIKSEDIKKAIESNFKATSDFGKLSKCDVVLICVPTPLTDHLEPDMQYIEKTGIEISKNLRRGQLIVLESTTYPGTTEEFLLPILEKSGLKAGVDFYLAFSPEREDPGNPKYHTKIIPKVVGGLNEE